MSLLIANKWFEDACNALVTATAERVTITVDNGHDFFVLRFVVKDGSIVVDQDTVEPL